MNLSQIVQQLKNNQVVAYPTEAVFGLGCNPQSETALNKLLALKARPWQKGLILVAPNLEYLTPYLDLNALNQEQLTRLKQPYAQPTTWVVPAQKTVSPLLRGQFASIAVRLCQHPPVIALCEAAGFALTSTSANLSGEPPCKTAAAVRQQFGEDFPALDLAVGHASNPSEIRDLLTGALFRKG